MAAGPSLVVPIVLWGRIAPTRSISCAYPWRDEQNSLRDATTVKHACGKSILKASKGQRCHGGKLDCEQQRKRRNVRLEFGRWKERRGGKAQQYSYPYACLLISQRRRCWAILYIE